MKKWIVTVLMMVGMISMVGCSDTPESVVKMYIEPAQLTEEEEKIAAFFVIADELILQLLAKQIAF